MTSAQHHDAIEALGSNGADPSLGVGVRLWGSPGRSEDLDAFRLEDFVEGCCEALVPVVHEEADGLRSVLPSLGEVASDLGAPGEARRTSGHPHQDKPGMQVDEEEHGQGLQPDRLDGEQGADVLCRVSSQLIVMASASVRLAGLGAVLGEDQVDLPG